MTTGNVFDASEMLQQLVNDTDKAVATLEGRAAAGIDLESQLADIQDKFDKAADIKDQKERELRLKVLTADLEELRKDAAKEQQDLAQAVFGLNAMLETAILWPSNSSSSVPVGTSHSFTVLSRPPVARILPSGEKVRPARSCGPPAWACRWWLAPTCSTPTPCRYP